MYLCLLLQQINIEKTQWRMNWLARNTFFNYKICISVVFCLGLEKILSIYDYFAWVMTSSFTKLWKCVYYYFYRITLIIEGIKSFFRLLHPTWDLGAWVPWNWRVYIWTRLKVQPVESEWVSEKPADSLTYNQSIHVLCISVEQCMYIYN